MSQSTSKSEHNALESFLRTITSTLESFYWISHSPRTSQLVLQKMEKFAWPKLAEVTLQCKEIDSVEWVKRVGLTATRVHFVELPMVYELYLIRDGDIFPAATHLRFSCAETAYLAQMLQDELRKMEPSRIERRAGAKLAHVVVQPLTKAFRPSVLVAALRLFEDREIYSRLNLDPPALTLAVPIPPGVEYEELEAVGTGERTFAADMHAVARDFGLGQELFTILHPHYYGAADAYRDWLDRMVGGPGCWDVIGG